MARLWLQFIAAALTVAPAASSVLSQQIIELSKPTCANIGEITYASVGELRSTACPAPCPYAFHLARLHTPTSSSSHAHAHRPVFFDLVAGYDLLRHR